MTFLIFEIFWTNIEKRSRFTTILSYHVTSELVKLLEHSTTQYFVAPLPTCLKGDAGFKFRIYLPKTIKLRRSEIKCNDFVLLLIGYIIKD